MPLFPKIAGPCPYVDRLSEIIDGDVCRMCSRQVFDLTAMTDGERLAFLAGCREEVCVSYSIPVRGAVRAAAIAAAIAVPGSLAARPAQPPSVPPVMIPVAGGLAPPPEVRMVEVPPAVGSAADLPEVYEAALEKDQAKPPAGKPRD